MRNPVVGAMTLATLLLACGSGNDPDSGTPPLVAIDDTINGAIAGAEADTFLLRAPTTGLMVVYLQALDSNIIEVAAEGYNVISHPVTSASYVNHAPLDANRTPRFPVVAESLYRVILRPPAAVLPRFRAGQYRFLPTMVDSRPEQTPAASPLSIDYTDETLASSHDVDEWMLGAPIADTMGVALDVTVEPGGTRPIQVALHTETAFNDFEFTIPATGGSVATDVQASSIPYQWFARIGATDPGPLQARAPVLPAIRVRTIVSDYRPEHRSAHLALDDSLTEERIDSVGDVDVWRLETAVGGSTAYVGAMAITGGNPGDTLRLALTDDFSAPVVLLLTVGDSVLLDHRTPALDPAFTFVTARVSAQHLGAQSSRPTYRFMLVPAASFSLRQTLDPNHPDR